MGNKQPAATPQKFPGLPTPENATDRRFLRHVQVDEDGHWLWTGKLDEDGYGRFRVGPNEVTRPHIYAFRRWGDSDIPAGFVIDHQCEHRNCCAPFEGHLRPTTQTENVRRGASPSAENARKDSCPVGHPYTESNMYHINGRRVCRQCRLDKAKLRRKNYDFR